MLCKLCRKDKKLIDAHIVPKALIREVLPPDKKALLVIEKGLHYTPRSWTGEYDSEILCASCDAYLGTFEQIGIETLRSIKSCETIVSSVNEQVKVYKLVNFDYVRFKLFFLTLLWKASVSKKSSFEVVSLGLYEEAVRQMLLNKDFGGNHDFSLFITVYRPSRLKEYQDVWHILHKSVMSPSKARIEGVTYYEFPVLEYSVYIKVSNQPIPKLFLPVSLMKNQPLHIFEREFDGSRKHENMLHAVLNQQKLEMSHKANKAKSFEKFKGSLVNNL